jgi:signal transduction histidine kinase
MRARPLFWPTVLFLLLVGLVTMIGIVGERNLGALAGGYAWVDHSRIILDELAHLRADVLQAESASRGYRMTGDRSFLAEFDAARDLVRARLGRLRELLADNPRQRDFLVSLASAIEAKLHFHESMHALVGAAAAGGDASGESAHDGALHMAGVEAGIARLRDTELALLEQRRESTQRTHVITRLAGLTLVVSALLLGILVFSLFARVIQAQRLETLAQHRRATDLSEAVAQATTELERRAAELERSNRDLEQFAFIASHDLQEPLRKIRTFADRIDLKHGADLGPESADSLRRIRSAAGRMQELVESLLEFSRVPRHGRGFESIDLAPVLAEVGEDLSTMLEREGGRLEVGWLPHVWGDRAQLGQLFLNLVANGLKFHREDVPPVIQIRGEVLPPADPKEPAMALISVSDNGIGFEPEYAERIFGLFQRLHGRGQYEGSGLGLAIARRIAEHHRGGISAEGRPGIGAILRVELPLPPATESAR